MSNRILFEDWQKPSNKKLHDFSDYIQAIEDFANKNGGTIQAIDSVKHPFQDIIEKQTIKVELPNKTYIITLEVAHGAHFCKIETKANPMPYSSRRIVKKSDLTKTVFDMLEADYISFADNMMLPIERKAKARRIYNEL